MANGLLPCGLVYAAMAASAATGSMIAASATMIGFGLGTVPALVVVSAAAASLAVSIRRRLARLAPLVLVVAAILILARAFDWPKGERQHIHPAAHFDPNGPVSRRSDPATDRPSEPAADRPRRAPGRANSR
jgi:sulfite exporter TauE/SafE